MLPLNKLTENGRLKNVPVFFLLLLTEVHRKKTLHNVLDSAERCAIEASERNVCHEQFAHTHTYTHNTCMCVCFCEYHNTLITNYGFYLC